MPVAGGRGREQIRIHWGVIGIGREQWAMIAAALSLGGSVRAGLEDNFYLPDGTMARSNGELIAKARQMAEDSGRRPGDGRRSPGPSSVLPAVAEPVTRLPVR